MIKDVSLESVDQIKDEVNYVLTKIKVCVEGEKRISYDKLNFKDLLNSYKIEIEKNNNLEMLIKTTQIIGESCVDEYEEFKKVYSTDRLVHLSKKISEEINLNE